MLRVFPPLAHEVRHKRKWPDLSFIYTPKRATNIASSLPFLSGSVMLTFRSPITMNANLQGRCSVALPTRSIDKAWSKARYHPTTNHHGSPVVIWILTTFVPCCWCYYTTNSGNCQYNISTHLQCHIGASKTTAL